ncbi:MAG: hypothetical protein MI892_00965 [Desulfobacterales bacterium]|nr:hypothetical protein [Desulfobacterales bacterium]
MIPDDLITELPQDPISAELLFIEKIIAFMSPKMATASGKRSIHNDSLTVLGMYKAFCDAYEIKRSFPDITGAEVANVDVIMDYFRSLEKELNKKQNYRLINESHNRFKGMFNNGFVYKFSDDDYARVQELINEIRSLLSASDDIPKDHKKRLLDKLEGLQKELHKNMPVLDKLWGLIGDAGIVIGKFGENAKPIFDRIGEMMQITWKVQIKAEGLPENTPLELLDSKKKQIKEE